MKTNEPKKETTTTEESESTMQYDTPYFQSATSGLWYTNPHAAGTIIAIRYQGKTIRAWDVEYEFCAVCNTPLTLCGPADDDGEPSKDCLVCAQRVRIADLEGVKQERDNALRQAKEVRKTYESLRGEILKPNEDAARIDALDAAIHDGEPDLRLFEEDGGVIIESPNFGGIGGTLREALDDARESAERARIARVEGGE